MKIDVQHIAKLAKLRLEEDKVEMFARQMQEIVEMVEQLPPSDESLDLLDEANAMPLRKDEVGPSLSRDALLANAPQQAAGCFVVPKTVG